MGSQPAPPLANIWLSKFEQLIKDDAKLYERYMDDILRTIKRSLIEAKLQEINKLHQKLKFTIETEKDGRIPFLDLCIIHSDKKLSSTWYCKPTDTGLILNFHALAPKRYKKSVVEGFVHRIFRACSNWEYFDASLPKAKDILEKNQYPPEFYDPIIKTTLDKIIAPQEKNNQSEINDHPKQTLKLQYRGLETDNYIKQLKLSGRLNVN